MNGKNMEGYSDPTASLALVNVNKETKRFNKLRRTVLSVCELAGFQVRNLVVVDKKSGKIWR